MSRLEEWRQKVIAQSAQFADLVMELLRENDRLIGENVRLAAETSNQCDDIHGLQEQLREAERSLDEHMTIEVKLQARIDELEEQIASAKPECSICRRRHGLEITHACE